MAASASAVAAADLVYSPDSPIMNALYQRCLADRWTADRVQFITDGDELRALSPADREYFRFLFAFLATMDDLVGLDCTQLAAAFSQKDVAHYYAEQTAIEMVHARVYARILDLFFANRAERDRYVNAAAERPAFRAKVDWIRRRVLDPAVSLAEKYVLFILAEGIFFLGSFASIAYLRDLEICRGVAMANEYIARDESTHVEASCAMYLHHVDERLPAERVARLFAEAVEVEIAFVNNLRCSMVDAEAVCEFVRFTADRLLTVLGYPTLYDASPPAPQFPLRYAMSSPRNTNTIETQGTDYVEAVVDDI